MKNLVGGSSLVLLLGLVMSGAVFEQRYWLWRGWPTLHGAGRTITLARNGRSRHVHAAWGEDAAAFRDAARRSAASPRR